MHDWKSQIDFAVPVQYFNSGWYGYGYGYGYGHYSYYGYGIKNRYQGGGVVVAVQRLGRYQYPDGSRYENWLTYSESRLQFEWGPTKDPKKPGPLKDTNQRYGVTYLVVFFPDDNPFTDHDESEDIQVLDTYAWDGKSEKSQIKTFSPQALIPGKTGIVALVPIEIKVSSANSPTGSAPKYTVTPEIPKQGNADNLFSVWPQEDFTVKVKLPESFQLPPNLIKWNSPRENIPDNTKEHTFNWTAVGTKLIEVQVGESKFELWVDVPHVGDVGHIQAIATLPLYATGQIGEWAAFAQNYCNLNYPLSPKRDAIRHSYWCALSVSDGYVTQDQILYFATAHEFDNKWIDRQQAFNSTMDLWNNFVGSTVDISYPSLPPTPNISQILQVLEQKYSAGELWIYDGSTSQGASEGIILKSNGTKIHPVN